MKGEKEEGSSHFEIALRHAVQLRHVLRGRDKEDDDDNEKEEGEEDEGEDEKAEEEEEEA